MGAIWIGNKCIFAVDDHGVYAVPTAIECCYLGDAAFTINFTPIKLFEFFLILRVVDCLKSRIIAWNGTTVTSTLNVVLSSHWVDTGTFPTQVSGHQG